jgi:hypothetical protein
MRKEITRLLDLVRYSDPELAEISLGMLMCLAAAAPDRLHWLPAAGQAVLALAGILRVHASLSWGLNVRHAFNVASVILFCVMLAAEVHFNGTGDELFLLAVTSVALWCLYRTNYELSTRIFINKVK